LFVFGVDTESTERRRQLMAGRSSSFDVARQMSSLSLLACLMSVGISCIGSVCSESDASSESDVCSGSDACSGRSDPAVERDRDNESGEERTKCGGGQSCVVILIMPILIILAVSVDIGIVGGALNTLVELVGEKKRKDCGERSRRPILLPQHHSMIGMGNN
jgi:hypothetical protein